MRYLSYIKRVTLTFLFLFPVLSYAQQWRVVEKVNYSREIDLSTGQYTNRYILTDSNVYAYAAISNRGSNGSADTVNYDSLYNYKGGGHYSGNAHTYTSYRVGRMYAANNMLQTHSVEAYDTATEIWNKYSADTFVFNNGLATKMLAYQLNGVAGQLHYVKNAEYDYSYDANGRLKMSQVSLYGTVSTPPQPKWRTYYSYDGNGLLVKDSTAQYDNNSWVYGGKRVYGYDQSNRLQTVAYYIPSLHNNDSLLTKNFYTYSAQGLMLSDSLANIFSNSWSVHQYAYNSKGLKIADTFRVKNYPVEYPLTTYEYTSFDYISKSTVYYYDSANNSYDHFLKTYYKYELYWPVSVNETLSKRNTFTLYPNPATNVLHIDSKAGFDKGYIYNNMGQLVKQVQGNAKQVDISQLPVGNYVLQLINSNGQVQRNFVVL